MAGKYTYPGVYVEEVPSGVRTIAGVSTSIAAFIGYFKKGPMNEATQILNMGDFERNFGGLELKSEASYAIQQFFLNGGQEAWVVRTARIGTAAKANVEILDGIGGSKALTVEAINDGEWGNQLRVNIDYNTSEPGFLFNLNVAEYVSRGGTLLLSQSELFRNLSMKSVHTRFVETVVNDKTSGSKLIRVKAGGSSLPLQNGTVSGDLSTFPTLTATKPSVNVTIGTEGTLTADLNKKPTTLSEARSLLQEAIRSSKPENRAFASAAVDIVQNRLRIFAGPTSTKSRVTFSASGTDPTVTELKLDPASIMPFEGVVSGDLASFPTLTSDPGEINVTIGGEGPHTATFATKPNSIAQARTQLEDAIRAAHSSPAFTNARVINYTDGAEKRLIVVPGTAGVGVSFATTETDTTTAKELKLDTVSALSVEGIVSGDLSTFPTLTSDPGGVEITIGGDGPHTATFATKPSTLTQARQELENAIRGASGIVTFTDARVGKYAVGGEGLLIVVAGITGNTISFSAAPTDATTVNELKLNAASGASVNVQEYTMGAGAAIPYTAQGAGESGNDGSPPDGTALIGKLSDKSGVYALEDVDLFNLLCIPRTSIVSGENKLTKSEAATVISVGNNYCEKRRAFFIIDTPNNIDEMQEIKEWLEANSTLRHKNSALYFPRIKVADPLNEFRLRSFAASGTIAGLYARIDSTRGVWKAPAGTDATLVNVQALGYTLTDDQNGTLNPLGINCLRNFPIYGNVCWGSRTLDGSDQQASEWKYIPVRRLALFLEESLYRGTKWVVFEPNDEPLWAQIRLNVGTFMHNLFRQGAFQGTNPKEAYFVKCDKETTTQADIDLGIVNILVGFAPLKPAEFVVIKISQIAGQLGGE